MRSREEILRDRFCYSGSGEPTYEGEFVQIALLVEVLLDIRDALHNRKESKPPHTTGDIARTYP